MASPTGFALSSLAIRPSSRPRPTSAAAEPGTAPITPETRPTRSSRRATSHYNTFQTVCVPANDDPPCYAIATRHKPKSSPSASVGRDELPGYSCTVSAEAKLLLLLETVHPLHAVSESEWREVYMVLRGTLLSFHRVKDGRAGRLLRTYTLQHAEIGMATDSTHNVLVPRTRLAHLIPSSARRKAWNKDPDLFTAVPQTIMRLRLETDQFVLADSSEDRIFELVHAISAGIDISTVIDERSVPRQCTVPRRRRRQRPRSDADLTDPVLLAEQERILRDMYPAFAGDATSPNTSTGITRTVTQESRIQDPLPSPTREEDDFDLFAMREDFASPDADTPIPTSRPPMLRQTTVSTIASAVSVDTSTVYETDPANFTATGKWQPVHPRTPAQILRYTRRCMPVLLADSVRASDVLICNGRRLKINRRMEMLEEWELQPPKYSAHGFAAPAALKDNDTIATTEIVPLERTQSQCSSSSAASGSAQSPTLSTSPSLPTSPAITTSTDDAIDLAKMRTIASVADGEKDVITRLSSSAKKAAAVDLKSREASQIRAETGTEMHGVVFCF